jgi:hypothetical protein
VKEKKIEKANSNIKCEVGNFGQNEREEEGASTTTHTTNTFHIIYIQKAQTS